WRNRMDIAVRSRVVGGNRSSFDTERSGPSAVGKGQRVGKCGAADTRNAFKLILSGGKKRRLLFIAFVNCRRQCEGRRHQAARIESCVELLHLLQAANKQSCTYQ